MWFVRDVARGEFHENFFEQRDLLFLAQDDGGFRVLFVRLSGGFEIFGGLGLLIPQTRRAAAWGLVALLIAVFPANIYMATNPLDAGAASIGPVLRWARLPLQLVLIWWLLWCTRPRLAFR